MENSFLGPPYTQRGGRGARGAIPQNAWASANRAIVQAFCPGPGVTMSVILPHAINRSISFVCVP